MCNSNMNVLKKQKDEKIIKKILKKVLTITKISIKIILVLKMNTIQYVVIIAKRIHLFPYRTQKLSSLALMVLGG